MKSKQPSIYFYTEEISFILPHKTKIRNWIYEVALINKFSIEEINYTFCSDEFLHRMNLEYLDHDTLTDIITFDHSHSENQIISDIFISIDRVKSNAKDLSIKMLDELLRVIIHGVLHLIGYNDHTIEEKEQMRNKEDECVYLFHNKFFKNT